MELDEALSRLGAWGKWQALHFILLSFATMFPACWQMLAINFIGAYPEYHCAIENNENINDTIPFKSDGSYEQCEMYVDIIVNNETQPCTDGWIYYGDIPQTIVSEWDLVCDREYLKDLSQTILAVGVMVGAMFFTSLSDYIGRKPVFLFTQWSMVVVGIANAFVPNFYGFMVLRFFSGALQQGIALTGFVLTCELFAAKYRTFAGISIENFWGVAMCILSLLAYFIRYWVHLQVVVSLIGLVTVPMFWITSESVIWLCANNRVKEAERVIYNAAKLNNIVMPHNMLTQGSGDDTTATTTASTSDDTSKDQTEENDGKNKFLERLTKLVPRRKKEDDTSAHYTVMDLFRHKHLALYAICMAFIWFVMTLVYYGVSLSTGELAGDMYLNNAIMGLVEIPAYTSSFFMISEWGRRRSLIVFSMVAGVSLILSQVVPEKSGDGTSLIPLRVTFSMIGKFGITGAFGIVLLYTPEIFPTTLRGQAVGISSMTGRIGIMIAPFTATMTRVLPWLPSLLFGILSIGGALITLFLPETLNRPLPQTIEDIEDWARKDKDENKKSTTEQHDMSKLSNVSA